jgi:diaminohydroxyphosphoribosylaminopyrimidine deaminase/5-amino-6-(5-phosphoribosylamino)uracil reductase
MRAALALARRGLGETWPNPSVGCVVVGDGRVVGRGRTAKGGRPHAETEALARAGAAARGATVYVTLEPCAHQGATPPCTEALIRAGVGRVAYAVDDPDPRVAGRGAAALRAAGIAVESGVCAEDAARLNEGFFKRTLRQRPLVALKVAVTADGMIATRSGESQWITGEQARAHAHLLRATFDAIIVASGTAIADDPLLTCRLPGLESRSPVRVLFDAHLRTPIGAKLFRTAAQPPTWVFTGKSDTDEAWRAVQATGARLFKVGLDGSGHGVRIDDALAVLAGEGITRVLVEAGGPLAAAFLNDRQTDELVIYRAPRLMGGDGKPLATSLNVDHLAQTKKLWGCGRFPLGDDVVETFRVQN